ncbi:hypothetical protein OIDMADRAFT_55263 [Oidiodendron maius Zn]|uniref:Uncharacterized protein n=1 Tax=Oidiodendron maius (strain Zn) TaxID=913774 RepID=A0A0C3GXB0_OIDMZ|nr:hypothetical protein OIDMADRAFT_55263 [Oidiodendron maius Zn]
MSTRFGGIPHKVNPSAHEWPNATLRANVRERPYEITKVSGVLLRLPNFGDTVTYFASVSCDARSTLLVVNRARTLLIYSPMAGVLTEINMRDILSALYAPLSQPANWRGSTTHSHENESVLNKTVKTYPNWLDIK